MSIENIEKQFSKMDLIDRSKPEPPSFSDMPNEIIDEIAGNLAFIDRLVIRKVSRYLRGMIDKRNPRIKRLSVFFFDKSSQLQYTDYKKTVKYSQLNDKCSVEYGKRKNEIDGVDHWELSINDLAIVMKNPKLQLEELRLDLFMHLNVSTAKTYSEHLKSFFESLNQQIHTKNVIIVTPFLDVAMSILPFLKPGTLERISIFGDDGYNSAMLEIVKLEQWKQAKILIVPDHNLSVSIEHVFHFNRFNIKLQSISIQDAFKIRDVLLRSPNFNYAFISFPEVFNIVVILIKQIFEPGFPCNIHDPVIFKVPDSDEVFKLLIRFDYISIDKIVL